MKLLLFLTLLVYMVPTYALDISKYKERLRSHMANMLGKETTNKILGEAPRKEMSLPEIPKVKVDAKDLDYFNKQNSKVYEQGEKYNSLSLEEKRSFRVSFLQQLFEVTRNAEAKKEDVVKYLNVLEQDGSREGVYRSIVLDQVYLALESYEETPSDNLVNFIINYSMKYLAIQYQPDSIRKFNLWSLKRIITEKNLELLEVLAQKPNDLYQWYAVFSAEMAKNYASIWNSDTRKNSSDIYHYRWAQTVPFQHIKSEVIIKIHKVMNFLNQK